MNRFCASSLIVATAALAVVAQVSITGKVVDNNGSGVASAQVKLVTSGISTTTSAQGSFTLSGTTSVRFGCPSAAGSSASSKGVASIYTSRGERVTDLNSLSAGGGSSVRRLSRNGSQIFVVKVDQGERASVNPRPMAAKSLATVDTLQISKSGFLTRSIPISLFTGTRSPDTLYPATIALGAKDEWQNITPAGADLSDNGVLDVAVDRLHPGTVYVALDKGGIRKSTDCGNTWVLISTGRNADVLNTGGQWALLVDFVEPQILYTMNLYGSNPGMFKSTDGGVDWDMTLPPEVTQYANFVQHISMDQSDHNHISANFHEDCSGPYGAMCMTDSRDGGKTWRMFKGPISGWSEAAGLRLLSPSTMIYTTLGSGVYFSGDSGASWSKCNGTNDGKLQNPMYRTKDGVLYMGSSWGAVRSYDGGLSWAKAGDNAPGGEPIIGDGDRLFSGRQTCCGTTDMFSTATEGVGTDWKTYPCPSAMLGHRTTDFAYDKGYSVLYSATNSAGVWRVVTK